MPPEELDLHISLIGVASSKTDIFSSILPGYSAPMETGNHLRWFFRPELGFPEKFTVYRSTDDNLKGKIQQWIVYDISFANPDDNAAFFNDLARKLFEKDPTVIAEFSFSPLEHPTDFFAKGSPAGVMPPAEYINQVYIIEDHLALFCNPSNPTHQFQQHFDDYQSKKTSIRPIEALLLASLDPFIARLMGLYFIDRSPNQDIHAYYVDADYGKRQYPLFECNFREKPPSPFGTVGYKIGICTMFHVSGVLNQSSDPQTKGLLFADPLMSGQSIFYLSFETPVEEVHISFWGNVYGTLNVVLQNGVEIPYTLENNQLIVSPETGGTIISLNLGFEHTGRIYISSLAWREKRGSIGVLRSNVSIVYTNSNPPLPPSLDITALRQATMPPILDANGRLNTNISKVKMALALDELNPLIYESGPKPVRYVLGKRTGYNDTLPDNFTNPEEPGLLSPADPAFLGLLLFFNFNKKNFSNLADNLPVTVKGKFEFSNPTFRAIDFGVTNLQNFPLFSGEQYLLLRDVESLRHPVNAFTLGATVYPMLLADGEYMTILDYNWQTSLWFGLVRRGERLFVHVVLNGTTFDSTQSIELAKQPPHRLIVAYNGLDLKIYIDAAAPEIFATTLGPLEYNRNGILCIGANVNSQGERAPESFFNGHLNDVYFWAKALNPYEVKKALVDNWDKFLPKEIDSPYTRNPFSYFEQFVPNGDYTYFAKGIDFFGRMSEWGRPQRIEVQATPPRPNAPQSVKARFIQWKGIISAIDERQAEDGSVLKTLHTTINGGETDFGKHEAVFTRHGFILADWPDNRTEAEITRSGIPKGQLPYDLRQKIEIYEAPIPNSTEIIKGYSYDNAGLLTILDNYLLPPFAQIEPQQGDEILIELDKVVEVEWQWTGLQQIYNPSVERFDIHHLQGIQNQVDARVQSVSILNNTGLFELRVVSSNHEFKPDLFKDRFCDINNRSYKIIGHDSGNTTTMQVRYEGYPILMPKLQDRLYITIPEGKPDYKDLKQLEHWGGAMQPQRPTERFEPIIGAAGIATIHANKLSPAQINELRRNNQNDGEHDRRLDWIPEADPLHPEASDLWELQLTSLPKPQGYQNPLPADYVPDALVVAVQQEDGSQQYEVLYILWRTWSEDSILRLYTSLSQQPAHPPEGSHTPHALYVPVFAGNRPLLFYTGRKFSQRVVLENLVVPPGEATEMHQITVTAFSPENGTSIPAAYASLVAVDRRKPTPPPMPRIGDFGKADYHNLSEVEIAWDPSEATAHYQLYRATDADIFAQDMESRRLRVNGHADKSPTAIFENQTAWFDAFIHKDPAVIAPALVGRLAALTLDQLFGHEKNSDGWKSVTPVWQYWADWFYPSLRVQGNTDEIKAIADLDGNQAAFTLVNAAPIAVLTYTDKVNGAVNNRYYYRLRAQGQNLTQSGWGATSLGKAAGVPSVPPRTPVFTKVEAGDRQITLQWALNREPDLKGYVLYRSQNKDLLEDLRWFDAEFPNGNALVQRMEIPDPRILVRNREIVVSDEVPIERIVGVYRAEEFDFRLPLEAAQVGAVNFWEGGAALPARGVEAHTYRIPVGRVGDWVEMVVVVRNNLNNIILINYGNVTYPFLDIIESRTKVNYRIVANAESGKRSPISQLTTGIAL